MMATKPIVRSLPTVIRFWHFPGLLTAAYNATYPASNPDSTPSVWVGEGKAGKPILNMLDGSNDLPRGPQRHHRREPLLTRFFNDTYSI